MSEDKNSKVCLQGCSFPGIFLKDRGVGGGCFNLATHAGIAPRDGDSAMFWGQLIPVTHNTRKGFLERCSALEALIRLNVPLSPCSGWFRGSNHCIDRPSTSHTSVRLSKNMFKQAVRHLRSGDDVNWGPIRLLPSAGFFSQPRQCFSRCRTSMQVASVLISIKHKM